MLATKYGVATKYFGVTHPSLPNYLAAISGDFQGIFDDCPAGPLVTCPPEEFIPGSGDGTSSQLMTPEQAANAAMIPHWFSGRTIVDQLEEKGMTWSSYFGYLPAAGDTTNGAPIIPTAEGGTEELESLRPEAQSIHVLSEHPHEREPDEAGPSVLELRDGHRGIDDAELRLDQPRPVR